MSPRSVDQHEPKVNIYTARWPQSHHIPHVHVNVVAEFQVQCHMGTMEKELVFH